MKNYIKNTLKIIISILFFISVILGINVGESNAHGIQPTAANMTVHVEGSWGGGENITIGRNNVFCIQEGTGVSNGTLYKVAYYAKIVGKTATIYKGNGYNEGGQYDSVHSQVSTLLGSTTNTQHAVMAYLVSFNGGNVDHVQRAYTNQQKAIYGYISTWLNANKKYITGISTNSSGYSYQSLVNEGLTYAQELDSTTASITNNTKTNNIKPEIYTYNGVIYNKVGPFNFTYTGEYSDKKIYVLTAGNAEYPCETVNCGETAELYSKNMFDALRTADEKGAEMIFAEIPFPRGGIATALRNRIYKSCGGNVISC